MDKYKRYYGVFLFVAVAVIMLVVAFAVIKPKAAELKNLNEQTETQEQTLSGLEQKLKIVQAKIKKIRDSISGSQKRIYYPVESDLGNDTIFFTLYSDLIEMVHANSVKIKSIDYTYNPEQDEFVKFGKDVYFVCDVDMELVSNYVKLGKLIQDIYQYPYYIKINKIDIKPYERDKKVLITNMSLRLYAHTEPEGNNINEVAEDTTIAE